MYDCIIISSLSFGSIYLFTTSLKIISHSILMKKNISTPIYLMNGLTMIISGTTFMYIINKSIKYNKY
jgi:hypothetical protein